MNFLDFMLGNKNKQGSFVDTSNGIGVFEPADFDDVLNVVKALRQNVPMLINVTHLSDDLGARGIDFVCGAVYALGGKMRRVSPGVYFYAPEGQRIIESQKRKKNGTH